MTVPTGEAWRPHLGGQVGRLALFTTLLLVLGGVPSGCRAVDFLNSVGEEHLDLPRMESDIQSRLEERLEARWRTPNPSATSVSRVHCRKRSELSATCFARVGRARTAQRYEIEVSVDPDTGSYNWEVVGQRRIRARAEAEGRWAA